MSLSVSEAPRRAALASLGTTVGTLARYVVALAGFVLALRLAIWVVSGAGTGWPPDEHYPGLRAVLLVMTAFLPVVCAVVGAAILVAPRAAAFRWRARLLRVAGFGFIVLAILLADHLIGLGSLIPLMAS